MIEEKRNWTGAALILVVGAVGCATPDTAEPIVPVVETQQQRMVSQDDLEGVVLERAMGYWGQSGWLVRIAAREFVVHRPDDGEVVARSTVDGQLISAAVSPDGSQVCVIAQSSAGGSHYVALYDTEIDEWRWEEVLGGSANFVVAGATNCMVGYQGDRNPEVFEAADGRARIRHMSVPAEPMGIFTSVDDVRQWWITPVESAAEEAAEEAGTQWRVTQIEIQGWTFEGDAQTRCFEADESEIRAVAAGDHDPALAEMARRGRRSYNAGACQPATPDELIRFGDGEHRLSRGDVDSGLPEAEEVVVAEEASPQGEEGRRAQRPDRTERPQRARGVITAGEDEEAQAEEDDESEASERRSSTRQRGPIEGAGQRAGTVIRSDREVIRRFNQ